MSATRLRAVAGLLMMLAAIAQSTVGNRDSIRLELVVGLAAMMSAAWLLQLSRWLEVGLWVLGAGAAALMTVEPGPGAVIGAISALVLAGMRLPVRRGALLAVVIGVLFVAADFWGGHGEANLVGSALTATGLGFAYFAAI